jgi:hypothetical protein
LQTNHFGVGLLGKQWQVDLAVHTHPSLGLSSHISLTKNFGSNAE